MNRSPRTPSSASIVVGLVAFASLAVSGCQSMEDCAKETFSKEFSCPTDGVSVRARSDVDGWAVTHDPPQPPQEVKDDPARYRVWKDDQDEQRAQFNKRLNVYEAKGCNHEALYDCNHPSNPGAPSTNCSRLGPAK
jgi:hypothetical protein